MHISFIINLKIKIFNINDFKNISCLDLDSNFILIYIELNFYHKHLINYFNFIFL